jgi:hypothetical protein
VFVRGTSAALNIRMENIKRKKAKKENAKNSIFIIRK